jgi:hypothetical protein
MKEAAERAKRDAERELRFEELDDMDF